MATETEEQKAKQHLHDMEIEAVRLVPKGANARNGFLLMKSDEPAADAPAPVDPPPAAEPAPATPPAPAVKTTEVDKSVTLREGESLEQFKEELRGGFNAATNPSNLDASRMWVQSIFDSFIIAEKFDTEQYFRFDWQRGVDGKFAFGAPLEVERKVSFEPVVAKTPAPVEPPAPATPTPAATPQPASKGAKSAKEKIAALAAALRSSLHDLVDEAMSTQTAPAVAEPVAAPAPAAKAAKPVPEQGRPNALSTSAPEPEPFQWHEGNLNDLRRSQQTGAQ
jgi:hypothetical protein